MANETPRRVTRSVSRAASVAPSVPGAYAVHNTPTPAPRSARASESPGPRNRRGANPNQSERRPSIQSNLSHAYGGAGRRVISDGLDHDTATDTVRNVLNEPAGPTRAASRSQNPEPTSSHPPAASRPQNPELTSSDPPAARDRLPEFRFPRPETIMEEEPVVEEDAGYLGSVESNRTSSGPSEEESHVLTGSPSPEAAENRPNFLSLVTYDNTFRALAAVVLACAILFFTWHSIPKGMFEHPRDFFSSIFSWPGKICSAIASGLVTAISWPFGLVAWIPRVMTTTSANNTITVSADDFQRVVTSVNELHSDVYGVKSKLSLLDSKVEEIKYTKWSKDVFSYGVNYFSASTGSVIDPEHTSPTMTTTDTGAAGLLLRLKQFVGLSYLPRGPVHALLPWTEEGECWCAVASTPATFGTDGGEPLPAELGVRMPGPVFPTAVTIEHVMQHNTIYPNAAPREIEFWGLVNDPLALGVLRNEVGIVPDKELDSRWVLLGKFKFLGRDAHNVQTFKLDVDLRKYSSHGIRNAMVRAVSNHGSTFTCFYRVRLHGWDERIWRAEEKARKYGSPDLSGLTTVWNE